MSRFPGRRARLLLDVGAREAVGAKCLLAGDTLGRLGLCGDQRRVDAAVGEEVVMGALLHDSPLLEDDDPVGAANRREAVSDHERGPPLADSMEREVELLLVACVETRHRFVEDEYR